MNRKRMLAFLLALYMAVMTGLPAFADGLLEPPDITMTIVGDYVFSNDIPSDFFNSMYGIFYDGEKLYPSDYTLMVPQDQYPEERLYIRIPLSKGKTYGEITLKIMSLGYKEATTTFSFPVDPDPISHPSAPQLLKATALSDTEVKLTWKSTSQWEAGHYNVYRKRPGGDFEKVKEVEGTKLTFTDTGLKPDTEYLYGVDLSSVKGVRSELSNALSVTTDEAPVEKPTTPAVTQPTTTKPETPQTGTAAGSTELRFYVGSSEYYVNNHLSTMDTTPMVLDGRTLLPIKYATGPLGAMVDWNAAEQKVTITTGSKTIELWIGKNTARINGVATQIDPNNPSVKPILVPPGRTMLPLRFVVENLGCDLQWNPAIQEVKILTK